MRGYGSAPNIYMRDGISQSDSYNPNISVLWSRILARPALEARTRRGSDIELLSSNMRLIKQWGGLVSWTAALLGAGLLLIFYYSHIEVIKALGEALFIAGILMLPVDYVVKKHLVRDASRDVAKYIWGYGLPQEIVNKAWESLESNKIIRRNSRLAFVITPVNEQSERSDRIELRVSLEWELENVTSEMQSYQQEQDFHLFDDVIISEAWFIDNSNSRNNYRVPNPALEIDGKRRVFKGKKRKLKPGMGQVYKCGITYVINHPVEYVEYIFFGGPAIGATITAEFPDEFEFFPPPTESQTGKRWEYPNRPFIKGDYIDVKWYRKSAAKRL